MNTPKPWTEVRISRILAFHFHYAKNIVLPNYDRGLVGWEADLVVVRPSGWAEEIEIKISKADFRAEFREKKAKHRQIEKGNPPYLPKPHRLNDDEGWRKWTAAINHPDTELRTSERDESYVYGANLWGEAEPHFCRRFWFAMPEELATQLLEAGEIPEYAGLMAITDRERVRVVKEAPVNKMAQKVDANKKEHILKCAYHRFWSQDIKHRSLRSA